MSSEWVTLMIPSGNINLVTLAVRVPKIVKMMINEKDDDSGDAEIKGAAQSYVRNLPPSCRFSPSNENRLHITCMVIYRLN